MVFPLLSSPGKLIFRDAVSLFLHFFPLSYLLSENDVLSWDIKELEVTVRIRGAQKSFHVVLG
jgi:hypothetical protein